MRVIKLHSHLLQQEPGEGDAKIAGWCLVPYYFLFYKHVGLKVKAIIKRSKNDDAFLMNLSCPCLKLKI